MDHRCRIGAGLRVFPLLACFYYAPSQPLSAQYVRELERTREQLRQIGWIEPQSRAGDTKEVSPAPLPDLAPLQDALSVDFPFQTRQELKAYILRRKTAIEYSKLFETSRVVLIGEAHPDVTIKHELASHMEEIRRAGVGCIGLEMLPSDDQLLLTRYLHPSDRDAAKVKVLRGKVRTALEKKWGWTPDAYMEVIDAAKEQGLEVFALDIPLAQQEALKVQVGSGRLKVHNASGEDVSLPPEAAIRMTLRNRYMAGKIRENLRDSNAKMLVLTGAIHAKDDGIPAEASANFGKTAAGYLVLGSMVPPATGFESAYEQAIMELNLSQERFFLDLPPKTHFAGLISLPY